MRARVAARTDHARAGKPPFVVIIPLMDSPGGARVDQNSKTVSKRIASALVRFYSASTKGV